MLSPADLLNRTDEASLAESLPRLPSLKASLYCASLDHLSSGFRWLDTRHGGYAKNSSLIALSSWKHSSRYIRCGVPVEGLRRCCMLDRYCCYCSWRKGRALSSRITPAWPHKPHWAFLTVSWTSNLPLSCTSPAYRSRLDEPLTSLRNWTSSLSISGAVSVCDLSLPSLAARQLFPHTHIILCSSDALLDDLEAPSAHLLPELDRLRSLGCSVSLKPITSREHLATTCSYLHKAIDLKRVYLDDLASSYPLTDINQGLDATLDQISLLEKGYYRSRAYGCLRAGSRTFLGQKKD